MLCSLFSSLPKASLDVREEFIADREDIGVELEEISDESRARRSKRLNFYSECNSDGAVGGFSSGRVLMKLVGETPSSPRLTFEEIGDEFKICGVQGYSPKYRQISLKDSHNNLGHLRSLPHIFVTLMTYRNTENQGSFRRLLERGTRELVDLVRLNDRRICLMNDPGNFRVRLEFYVKSDFRGDLGSLEIPLINPSNFVYTAKRESIISELHHWMLMINQPLDKFINTILLGCSKENLNCSIFSDLSGELSKQTEMD